MSFVEEELGSALWVWQSDRAGVDAEVSVEGGEDIFPGDGAGRDFVTESIGAADDLSGFDASAGEEGGAGLWPVVSAAGFGVDSGCASEFAPDDDAYIVEHSSFFEISDECMQAVVNDGKEVAHAGEVIAVRIEVADGDTDAADAGFDESSSEEEFADGFGSFAGGGLSSGFGSGGGISLEDLRIFGLEIECVGE